MVFNAPFNNISVILWHSVLLVEETGVPVETTSCRKSLTNLDESVLKQNYKRPRSRSEADTKILTNNI